jgi:hypothetical protein
VSEVLIKISLTQSHSPLPSPNDLFSRQPATVLTVHYVRVCKSTLYQWLIRRIKACCVFNGHCEIVLLRIWRLSDRRDAPGVHLTLFNPVVVVDHLLNHGSLIYFLKRKTSRHEISMIYLYPIVTFEHVERFSWN